MRVVILILLLAFSSTFTYGQAELFGPGKEQRKHSGFILNGNVSADLPLMDMAKRFGADYRAGASLTYKTESNWIFGIKYDFLLGNNIKEDSFVINIKDKYSGAFNGKLFQTLNINGQRVGVVVYERGYLAGLQGGKIFTIKKGEKDNGILVLTTVGMIQHKINIYNRDNDVEQLVGDYKKGYDRLTKGWFAEQYVGYIFFAKNRLTNFNAGLDFVWAFTQGQRPWLFDVQRPDNKKRNDVLIGVRAGWMIPIFKRKSEDISFE